MSAFVLILEKFEPQINKFQRNSVYEDMNSDLTLFMFNLLNKVPLEKECFKEDKYIISYISKSLRHQYIYLNKTNYKIVINEGELEENCIKSSDYNYFSNLTYIQKMLLSEQI